jgi:hypothetical protein
MFLNNKFKYKNMDIILNTQAHVPLFRLDGPYAHPDAEGICANELLK